MQGVHKFLCVMCGREIERETGYVCMSVCVRMGLSFHIPHIL